MNAIKDKAFETVSIDIQDAKAAYISVLKGVGASFKRDTMDERIIQDVVQVRGMIIDVQGHFPHGTEYQKTLNAWPSLKTLPSLKDMDNDGMPDAWEVKMGLDPNMSDDKLYSFSKQFTNIEMYLNSIIE
jgi:hypothetical protein